MARFWGYHGFPSLLEGVQQPFHLLQAVCPYKRASLGIVLTVAGTGNVKPEYLVWLSAVYLSGLEMGVLCEYSSVPLDSWRLPTACHRPGAWLLFPHEDRI